MFYSPVMPRFGLVVPIAGRFSSLTWFGLGPHETYVDRRASAKVGVFSGRVSEQLHPYLRPQERQTSTRAQTE